MLDHVDEKLRLPQRHLVVKFLGGLPSSFSAAEHDCGVSAVQALSSKWRDEITAPVAEVVGESVGCGCGDHDPSEQFAADLAIVEQGGFGGLSFVGEGSAVQGLV